MNFLETQQSIIIPSEYFGQRVDVTLAQLCPQFSRSQIGRWLQNGTIHLNQSPLQCKTRLRGGETVLFNVASIQNQLKNHDNQAENIPLNIVYEDDDLLVINKPAGLVVHPGAGNHQHTLVNALLHYHPASHLLPRAGIVHRLDKDTTGLLLVAKHGAAYQTLIAHMQARTIQRHYWALVHGTPSQQGMIDTPFGRHPKNRLKMAVLKQGKQAITAFEVQAYMGSFTLINVKLFTGRTHQIRVHMAHIKHPLLGDPLYGSQRSNKSDITFNRQALHAFSLSFLHPMTQHPLTLTAPMPDDLYSLQLKLQALHQEKTACLI